MIDISKLSKRYSVRVLEESDVETLARICKQNTVFYEYTEARPTKENILNDMKETPPGITMDDKYYFGFFMMNPQYQGKQTGTAIIAEVIDYLQGTGKTSVRLAIDKGNPQSTHFWKKNGFDVISEADVNGWTKLVAEKRL